MVQPAETALSRTPDISHWPAATGVASGEQVLLTADVTRISWLLRREGARQAPRRLLDTYLEAVGPNGTVVVPTFNYDLRSGDAFDRLRTPTISGVLGQAALDHPAFVRTAHPLHSFAVAGKLRYEFLQAMDPSSFGGCSPFAVFRQERFKLVGLDLPLDLAMSYFHHVEEMELVPYRRWRLLHIRYTDQDGSSEQRTFRLYAKRSGYVNRLAPLVPLLEADGSMHSGKVDGVGFLRVDLAQAHTVIMDDIRRRGARSIVQFTWKSWLRDRWHALVPHRRPTATERSIRDRDAGVL